MVDSGASAHMSSLDGMLLTRLTNSISSILVGNGSSIPVMSRDDFVLSTKTSNFALNNALVVPLIVQNLLFVRHFTDDNHYSIDFYAFNFSVEGIPTPRVILAMSSSMNLASP